MERPGWCSHSGSPLAAAHHPPYGERLGVDEQQIRILPHTQGPLAGQPQRPGRVGRDHRQRAGKGHAEGTGPAELLPQAPYLAATQLDETPLAIETRQAGIGIGAEADALGEHPDGQQ